MSSTPSYNSGEEALLGAASGLLLAALSPLAQLLFRSTSPKPFSQLSQLVANSKLHNRRYQMIAENQEKRKLEYKQPKTEGQIPPGRVAANPFLLESNLRGWYAGVSP